MDFILVTTYATVLSRKLDGRYEHVYYEDVDNPILFKIHDGHLSAPSDAPDALRNPIPVPNTDRFAFRVGDAFLSAVQGGGFRSRKHIGQTESFFLVRYADSQQVSKLEVVLPRKVRGWTIPKIIHQTSPVPILSEFQLVSKELRLRNPGWAYRHYADKDQHDFIYECFGWDILRQYLKIDPRYGAVRSDFFRYLCVYQNGGVYLDIKSTSRVALDDIIRPDDEFILCQWDNETGGSHEGFGLWPEVRNIPGGEFQQWHIMAARGHPFLEAAILSVLKNIESYNARLHGIGWFGTLRTSGPIMYTRAIAPLLPKAGHRFLDRHSSGLQYSAIDDHKGKIGPHYSTLTAPIINR